MVDHFQPIGDRDTKPSVLMVWGHVLRRQVDEIIIRRRKRSRQQSADASCNEL